MRLFRGSNSGCSCRPSWHRPMVFGPRDGPSRVGAAPSSRGSRERASSHGWQDFSSVGWNAHLHGCGGDCIECRGWTSASSAGLLCPGLLRPLLHGAVVLCTRLRDGLRSGLCVELRPVVLLPSGRRLHRGAGRGDPAVGLLHDRLDDRAGRDRHRERCEGAGEGRLAEPLAIGPASERPRGAVAPRGRLAAPAALEGFVGNRIADSRPIRLNGSLESG